MPAKEPRWIAVNNHAPDYFGGVPGLVACDNCKQAVIANGDWIAPELNKDHAEWAEHNQTVILPAKIRRPGYKSSVENAVGILEKGFFHEMEERRYFSPEQFSQDLWGFPERLNREPFKKKEHGRYLYREEEKPELMPLPSVHYEYTERRTARVSGDFHVRFDNAYYSVNKAYVHREVLVKATAATIRIYGRQGEFLCEWPRAEYRGKWSANPDHLALAIRDTASGTRHFSSIRQGLWVHRQGQPSGASLDAVNTRYRPAACASACPASAESTGSLYWKGAAAVLLTVEKPRIRS